MNKTNQPVIKIISGLIGFLQLCWFFYGCQPQSQTKDLNFAKMEKRLLKGDTDTRIAAAKVLAEGKDFDHESYYTNQMTYLFLEGVKDDNPEVRALIATAMGHVKEGAIATKVLMRLIDDRDPLVRVKAVEALGVVHNPNTLETIFYAMKDRSSQVKIAAIQSAGKFQGKKVTRRIVRMLRDNIPAVRIAAAEALGRLGDPAAINALEKAGRRKNRQVAEKAREAIEAIKQKQKAASDN